MHITCTQLSANARFELRYTIYEEWAVQSTKAACDLAYMFRAYALGICAGNIFRVVLEGATCNFTHTPLWRAWSFGIAKIQD